MKRYCSIKNFLLVTKQDRKFKQKGKLRTNEVNFSLRIIMEDLELLTDEQLRSRLLQYGFANLPVTDTTRKILVKKLRLAIDGQTTKNRRETVAVSKLSSDDEPEKETTRGSKRDKTPNRRATTAAMEKVKSSVIPTTNGTLNNVIFSTETSKKASRRLSKATAAKDKTLVSSPAYLATDSDEDIIEVPVTRRSRTPSLGKSEIVRTSYKTTIKALEENVADETARLDDDKEPISETRNPSSLLTQTMVRRKVASPASQLNLRDEMTPSSHFGRASLSTSYNPRANYNFVGEQDDEEPLELNETNTPYLSSFAKRLSTLRAEPLDAGLDKYKSLRDNAPTTSSAYKTYQQKNHSKTCLTPVSVPAVAPRQRGNLQDLIHSIAPIFDSLDRQYNFRTTLYTILIVMIVVAIYVIFM